MLNDINDIFKVFIYTFIILLPWLCVFFGIIWILRINVNTQCKLLELQIKLEELNGTRRKQNT